ncbi:hypothetical protein [Maribacter sp. 2308TA10-17]|uniref:hypothetical protein n=1 Tax=Maribacter sp. 2308TA10-17 TaxID=3386276 RepID=UPI0039BC599A
MKRRIAIPVIISLLWIGFVAAISFMEAWLKFRAPGVTLEIGLSIGRLVFNALNKVELLFGTILLIHSIYYLKESAKPMIQCLPPIIILVIQTLYVLPVLDLRAETIIAGIKPEPSYMHFYYVVLEAIKVISLILIVVTNFNLSNSEKNTF